MGRSELPALSRREREIMDILLRRPRASASEVQSELPDPPSYSAVRTMLSRLKDKGHVRHEQDGPRYVYSAAIDPLKARESALERMVKTFFAGSSHRTVAALLDRSDTDLTDEELDELAELIARKREERR